MTQFEEAIKKYLDQVAAEDILFKQKYEAEGKSLTKCCDYIISEVKRIGRQGYADDEIYQMARHYYNEPDSELKIDSLQKGSKVVINEPIFKPEPVSKPKPKAETQQLSLFDLEI